MFKKKYLFASLIFNMCIVSATQANWVKDTWSAGVKEVKTVYQYGDNQLWVSGWAHHGRSSYSPEKLALLNERALGLGWAKTIRQDTIHRGIFGLVMLDSHKDKQYQVGYTYEKAYYFNQDNKNWYIAGGIAPTVVRREDMFKKIPFPAVFPLLSIGNKNAEIRMIYLPRLSNNLGNGDVLYVFTSFAF